MTTPHRFGADALQWAIGGGAFVEDPGNGQQISITKSGGVCELTIGAGAETRTLPDPAVGRMGCGTVVHIVANQIAGGSCTVEGVTFATEGQHSTYMVANVNGSKAWVASSATELMPSVFGQSIINAADAEAARDLLYVAPDWVSVQEFGALGDNIADDTAGLQAAINAASTSGRNVWIPPGVYRHTGLTITLAGVADFVSVRGGGIDRTRLDYIGASNGTAVTCTFEKNFLLEGFAIYNPGAMGTTTGLALTGPNDVGTQTTHGRISRVAVSNFQTGIRAGLATDKASSEILYDNVTFSLCGTGWIDTAANSLNHIFLNPWFSANATVGLKSDTSNITVLGGGGADNAIDWEFDGVQPAVLIGVYSERAGVFLDMARPHVRLEGCFVNPAAVDTVDQIIVRSGALTMEDSIIYGRLQCSGTGILLRLFGNHIRGDASTGLPFFVTGSNYAAYQVQGNRPADLPTDTTLPQFYSDAEAYYDADVPFKFRTVMGSSTAPKTRLAQYLNRVKAISSGPNVVGKNLRRSVVFATSDTAVIDFTRTVDAAVELGSRIVTVAAGGLTSADIGERIQIDGAGPSGGLLDTIISDVTNATTLQMQYHSAVTDASIPAILGEDEPDTKYMVAVGASAQETISWAKATTGITLTSSNATSTAAVDVIIVR